MIFSLTVILSSLISNGDFFGLSICFYFLRCFGFCPLPPHSNPHTSLTVPLYRIISFNRIQRNLPFIFCSVLCSALQICYVLLISSFLCRSSYPDYYLLKRWFPRHNNRSEQKWLTYQVSSIYTFCCGLQEGLFLCVTSDQTEICLLSSQSRRNIFSFLLYQLEW